jgi:hypothetical protein
MKVFLTRIYKLERSLEVELTGSILRKIRSLTGESYGEMTTHRILTLKLESRVLMFLRNEYFK